MTMETIARPKRAPRPAPITLTDAAAARVATLVARGGGDVLGLRIGVKARGCSGYSYVVEYAKDKKPFEDAVEVKGVQLFLDPSAMMFLIGTEMDWEEDAMQASFVFRNPNEKGRCGCGESFTV